LFRIAKEKEPTPSATAANVTTHACFAFGQPRDGREGRAPPLEEAA
jgi:hypothetical protein